MSQFVFNNKSKMLRNKKLLKYFFQQKLWLPLFRKAKKILCHLSRQICWNYSIVISLLLDYEISETWHCRQEKELRELGEYNKDFKISSL